MYLEGIAWQLVARGFVFAWHDIKPLVRTVPVVPRQRGAN